MNFKSKEVSECGVGGNGGFGLWCSNTNGRWTMEREGCERDLLSSISYVHKRTNHTHKIHEPKVPKEQKNDEKIDSISLWWGGPNLLFVVLSVGGC